MYLVIVIIESFVTLCDFLYHCCCFDSKFKVTYLCNAQITGREYCVLHILHFIQMTFVLFQSHMIHGRSLVHKLISLCGQTNGRQSGNVTEVTIGGEKLKVVADFHYRGDSLSSRRGCEIPATIRCKSTRNKFIELHLTLTSTHLLITPSGCLYSSYVQLV